MFHASSSDYYIFSKKPSAEKIGLFVIILIVVGNASAIVDPFRDALSCGGRERKGGKCGWVCVEINCLGRTS